MSVPLAHIDKMAYGGNGVCRLDGKVCFVPLSCPGDEVSLRIANQKKSYCTAEILTVTSPSPDRVVPACPVFGVCGGCHWQHLSYPLQLSQKQQIFAEMLWRGARIGAENISDIVAAPEQYGYRSRVQFKVDGCGGAVRIGFYRTGSHDVVDAGSGCTVAHPLINALLVEFRKILARFSEVRYITEITVDAGRDGAAVCIHCSGGDVEKSRRYFKNCAADGLHGCSGLFLRHGSRSMPVMIWGQADIRYEMPPLMPGTSPTLLTYQPGGFAQINQRQNQALLDIIHRLGSFSPTESLLELYCGNGNFSLPLASCVVRVVGIEENRSSIQAAIRNQAANNIENVEFICDDAVEGTRRLLRSGKVFDVVLLDPPRTGAEDVLIEISRLRPARIVYISCDPATLARDGGILATHGYAVSASVPLDMFPQTFHLESVTLFTTCQERFT